MNNKERNQITEKFNLMPEKEKIHNIENVDEECNLLEFKFYSLRNVLWFKQGYLKFDLSKGI